jgi:hypothetical protein
MPRYPIGSGNVDRLLHEAVARHSKTFVFAFSLTLPHGRSFDAGDALIETFVQRLAEELHVRKLDPRSVWTRKPYSLGQPAGYLFLVSLDGHRTHSAIGHLAVAERIWSQVLGMPAAGGLVAPLLHPGGSTGLMIRKDRRSWEQDLASCCRWARGLFS